MADVSLDIRFSPNMASNHHFKRIPFTGIIFNFAGISFPYGTGFGTFVSDPRATPGIRADVLEGRDDGNITISSDPVR